jgi:hypothetical protein
MEKEKKPIPSEHSEQVSFVNNIKLFHKEIFMHAIENSLQFVIPDWFPLRIKSHISSLCSKIAEDRKSAGQVNGVPDLFIPELLLYIEMKRTIGGVVSERQKVIHNILRQKGYSVEVAYGAKMASEILLKYKNQPQSTLTDILSLVELQKEQIEQLKRELDQLKNAT